MEEARRQCFLRASTARSRVGLSSDTANGVMKHSEPRLRRRKGSRAEGQGGARRGERKGRQKGGAEAKR